jgi:hypothetical protein
MLKAPTVNSLGETSGTARAVTLPETLGGAAGSGRIV